MRKTILITGASAGLGAGMAREFAARGRHLALCARNTDALESLRSELSAKYPEIRISLRALDVCNYDQVFEVFNAFREEFGTLDRIIVNAGIGFGAQIGTGHFSTNLRTATTNFTAALAQCEAAMEIFRAQNAGHLVAMSSVSAVRGFKGPAATYAATKAGLANLAEGIRLDCLGTPINVSTILPGYILTAINADLKNAPFRVDVETGCRALVKTIEREPASAFVPGWPWGLVARLMRWLPLGALARMG
ncbi:SDR family oxidoreductase [Abyssibacter profundi]|uniref:Short chain dehydrogenase n=1 Tax=Abyssibacter profundi TaxID=2182787 RepID=A0A383XPY8_9GAMM|nr:SDR family oxidoreductase [Abyssibacter profundi]MBV60901.1 short chain dehydrogenase [Nevskiales bacterium]PWN54692.1 short chain dehydrogenase [Abyssibacter profundi]